ncbi:DNA mismatch repair protein MSH3 [Amaranthus tricolor]|uniref:DNA mismatch repair protein MSH3 n=1 Tax=Amaranthus tricolor TaxID=29722 RepID=UPI002589886C|nr:DNA mismatch repair protein MSH3 [Amaranthus tricolor]
MGKQKQEVISKFFAPKPKIHSSPAPQNDNKPSHSRSSPSKIITKVSFTPEKRLKSLEFLSPNDNSSKRSNLSPHTENPMNNSSKRLKFSFNSHNPISSFPNSNPTLHQKFLQKLLEPSDDVLEASMKGQTLKESHIVNPKYTPLEQQVVELKNKYPDVLLMIEVGYKYRFFGKDAETAARVLGIYSHVDHNFLTASIPTFRLHVHVRRLVSEGYKVGVVKQTETASIKAHGSNRGGPFTRGLSALYTKATIEAVDDLGGGEEGCSSLNNYLFCVVENDVLSENVNCGIESGFEVKIGVVAVETSTGDVVYGEFNDGLMRNGLEAMLLSLSPAELLLGDPLSKRTQKLLLNYAGPASNVRVERASCDCFKDGGALAELMSLFENKSADEGLQDNEGETTGEGYEPAIKGIMDMPALAVQALAITVRHLKQFGLERVFSLGASFRPYSSNIEMNLSANTLQQLELLKNNSNGLESGSLLQTMNHTITTFGQRLLRHWVTHPLCDRHMIAARLDAVAEIADAMGGCSIADAANVPSDISFVLSSVLTTLTQSPDVQRGITRIYHKTATPLEFIAVVHGIILAAKQLQQLGIETIQSALLRNLIQTAASSNLINCAAKFLLSLNKEAAEKGDLLNLICVADGKFSEVDEARKKVEAVREELESLISLYRKQLKMHSLNFMNVSGTTHLIELPSEARVPSNWVKVNSTKKTVRYHPPEVLTALDRLSLANEELTLVCRSAWDKFLGEFCSHYAEFQAAIQALAALDCLHSLAVLSRTKNYVRPVFVDDKEPVQIQIISGCHPVLETILEDSFVPNDTDLHGDRQFCQIITGPNMGGKSCYIRQVALIAIMAQVGSFVPASSATLQVLDAIHTRMGASDNIQQGRSTFLEELSEASNILNKCTSRSLVIMDELGRGTSTHDGVAIAYATLHYVLNQKKSMVLFVTHYPKIAEIQKEFPGAVGTYHVSYLTVEKKNSSPKSDLNGDKMDHEDVTYLYKLVPGISQRSFGFKVAKLAQLPPLCIQRAIEMASKLETLIQKRTTNRLGDSRFFEEFLKNDVGDTSNNISDHADLLDEDDNRGAAQLTIAYMKFFRNLWSIFGDNDLAKKLEILKCARSAAAELIARQALR